MIELFHIPGFNGFSLLWLAITVLVYLTCVEGYRRLGASPWVHPLVTSFLFLWLVVFFTDTPVADFQADTAWLNWLLGPATVALAVPVYEQLSAIRLHGTRILWPIVIGGATAPAIAFTMLYLCVDDVQMQLAVLTKSITTPLAMDTGKLMGGSAALAAVFVIATGIFGSILAPLIFRLTNIEQDEVRGITMGTIIHAVGTASAFQISQRCGAFSTIALCINGVLTAIFLPLLYFWLN